MKKQFVFFFHNEQKKSGRSSDSCYYWIRKYSHLILLELLRNNWTITISVIFAESARVDEH